MPYPLNLDWEDFKLAEGPRLPADLPPAKPIEEPPLDILLKGAYRGILPIPTQADFDWARGRKPAKPVDSAESK